MAHPIELVEIPLSNRRLVKRFIRMVWNVYRGREEIKHWVPPLIYEQSQFLDPGKNPFFEHANCRLWVACVNGSDCGRIAAVVDAGNPLLEGKKLGCFGLFECTDEPRIAHALLDKAMDYLRRCGVETALGPNSLSTNHQSGLLVQGFDSDPCIEMPYNPRYYQDLLESYGLEKRKDLWQWRVYGEKPLPESVCKLAERFRSRSPITVRRMVWKNRVAEIRRMIQIYNEAWSDLWGFTPLTPKETAYLTERLRMVLRPETALIAEYDGQPVGLSLTIMDINPIIKQLNGRLFPTGFLKLLYEVAIRRNISSGRLILFGIKKEFRRRGIDAALYFEMYNAMTNMGWKYVDIGWTLENNDNINRAIAAFGGEHSKTFRLYGAQIRD